MSGIYNHSLLIITRDHPSGKKEFLVYYDDRWECLLFPNCRSRINGDDSEYIKEQAASEYNVQKDQIYCRYITSCIQEKYSVSHDENRIYNHALYEIIFDKDLDIVKEDQFIKNKKRHYWVNIQELEEDSNVMKKNADVLHLVKQYFDSENQKRTEETKMENEYKAEETTFGAKTTHPAYGTILFNRSYSNHKRSLFGSSIEHSNMITMELHHASNLRGYNSDSIFGNELIAKVEMSYSQFAEAITSFGQGAGIPCTIRYTEKDGKIPPCDFVSKREQFTEEFKGKIEDAMNESQQLIQDVADLFSQKKSFTKADKETVMNKLRKLSMDIGCNMEFVADQFNEQMDRTVMEAKGEIESFCQNKINAIANNTLAQHKEDILRLENPVDIEE